MGFPGLGLGGGFSKSKESSLSIPGYTPYQKKMQKFLTPQFQDILGGNFQSPMLRTLSQIAMNAARKETLPARKQLLEGYGMTGPAKAEAMGKLLPAQIEVGAEAAQSVWKAALEFLTGIAGQVPSQFSKSSGSSLGISGDIAVGAKK